MTFGAGSSADTRRQRPLETPWPVAGERGEMLCVTAAGEREAGGVRRGCCFYQLFIDM